MNRKTYMLGSVALAALALTAGLATAAVGVLPSDPAFANVRPGMLLTKESNAAEAAVATLTTELSSVQTLLKSTKDAMETQYKDLKAHYDGVKKDTSEVSEAHKKHTEEYAEMVTKFQTLTQAVDQIKKELDAPIIKGGKDLKDSDTEAAIELQKQLHLSKGRSIFDFKVDKEALIPATEYRGAALKMMQYGLESRETVVRSFTEAEKKAFEASGMDSGFFSPQMLGIEIDCNVECAELLDLYASVNVSKSTFMYPKILSYGDLGKYGCDAVCDAELGPEGNITYGNGQTFDFRGVFCLQKKTVQESNYDLLGFMTRAAARSHRINRNKSLITGDGVNQPKGWLVANCFDKFKTEPLKMDHVMFRRFLASAPVEYGPVIATMHQNMFAYLASQVDANGRFIYADGEITFSPDDARERIRISNCLPDATANGTRGNGDSPFVAGDFVAAAGNWKLAYAAVEKRPLWMEQYVGGSTAWCQKWQFGAEDGGFAQCCAAARQLVIG